jgi:protein TonB
MAASYRYRPSPVGRVAAAAVSLAICAIIIVLLIRMGLLPAGPGKPGERLTAVILRPAESRDRSQHAKVARHAEKRAARTAPRPVVPAPPVIKPPPVPPLQIIRLTHDEMVAADIGKMGKRPADGEAGNSASAYGPGEGPGGARLYRAEWYREPTRAELVTYMPHRDVPGGWAEIACRTQDHFHVDDCRELGESPPGSGLARALRQAAWQFLIRPPRIDGKPQIGTWVRIHFDFTSAGSAGSPDQDGR